MAKSGENRDTQRGRLYAWETSGNLKNFWNNDLSMTKKNVVELCHNILRTVGCTETQIKNFNIKFSVRNGNAYGSNRGVNFTAGRTPKILVLHEMAHALTYPNRSISGHCGIFVSCYMALLEKYLGLNIVDLANSLRRPVEKKQIVQTYEPIQPITTPARFHIVQREQTKIMRPPEFNPTELGFWRRHLGTINA